MYVRASPPSPSKCWRLALEVALATLPAHGCHLFGAMLRQNRALTGNQARMLGVVPTGDNPNALREHVQLGWQSNCVRRHAVDRTLERHLRRRSDRRWVKNEPFTHPTRFSAAPSCSRLYGQQSSTPSPKPNMAFSNVRFHVVALPSLAHSMAIVFDRSNTARSGSPR
jgi:hypothetical protein